MHLIILSRRGQEPLALLNALMAVTVYSIVIIALVSKLNSVLGVVGVSQIDSEGALLAQRLVSSADCFAYEEVHYDVVDNQAKRYTRVFPGIIDPQKVVDAALGVNGVPNTVPCLTFDMRDLSAVHNTTCCGYTNASERIPINDTQLALSEGLSTSTFGTELNYDIKLYDLTDSSVVAHIIHGNVAVETGTLRYASKIPVMIKEDAGNDPGLLEVTFYLQSN